MPRVTVTASEVTGMVAVTITATGGLTVATSDGLDFDNNGDVWLVLHNADAGGAHTVDFVAQGSTGGFVYTTHQESVAASTTAIVGPFDKGAANVAGKVQVNFQAGEEDHIFYKLLKFRHL